MNTNKDGIVKQSGNDVEGYRFQIVLFQPNVCVFLHSVIKVKQVFFSTSNSKGYGFHDDKATNFYLTSEYYSLSVLSAKLYFVQYIKNYGHLNV